MSYGINLKDQYRNVGPHPWHKTDMARRPDDVWKGKT